MSDDDEESQLRIDEDSPPAPIEKPPISPPSPSFSEPKKEEEPDEKHPKEEGELHEDEEEETMDTAEPEKPVEIQESSSTDVPMEVEEEPKVEEPVVEPVKKISENGSMKPPQSTEKTPNHRKRKESMDNFGDKRKSGLETIASASSSSPSSTPQRSKRASSHMATVAISQCFTEEDYVAVPMMPIQRTPTDTPTSKRAKVSNAGTKETGNNNNNHVEQMDASTNVTTTKSVDTSTLLCNETVMGAPPGSQLLLEVTVMYRTKSSLAFRVKGCDLMGFLGDGFPPIGPSAAGSSTPAGGNGNNNKKKTGEDQKDGRSSSASSNGRTTRGGSREPSTSRDKGKKDGKRKKEESVEPEQEEDQQPEVLGAENLELREVEPRQMHDCHFEGCEKRFYLAAELEYHITKNHQKRVMMFESICTQIAVETADIATETDECQLMPVLKKEGNGLVYEDLSDDDAEKNANQGTSAPQLAQSAPSSSNSAAAALMGIAQASSSVGTPLPPTQPIVRSTPSTPISAKIGINPSMVAQVNAQNAEKKRAIGIPQSIAASMPSSSSQPPPGVIQAPHPMQHFMGPPFQLMPHNLAAMAAMDPRMQAALSQQQQQQMARTPSRQMTADSHKIHELAKAKENEQRQRQATTPKTSTAGPSTPQRQFIPQHMMQTPVTPQSVQQAMAAQLQSLGMTPQQQQILQMQMLGGRIPAIGPEQLNQMMWMQQMQQQPGFPQQPPPK